MLLVTERNSIAQDAAVRVLMTTTFKRGPVLQWVRKIALEKEVENTVRIGVTFWVDRSPSYELTVSVTLTHKENGEWVPFSAWLKNWNDSKQIWDFDKEGNPVEFR